MELQMGGKKTKKRGRKDRRTTEERGRRKSVKIRKNLWSDS
jgi:hypothetical protein